jgi:hypothetical protein
MIRLNLTATPEWLDLAPDLRLLVGPLTTALMVAACADPAIEACRKAPRKRHWRSPWQKPSHAAPCWIGRAWAEGIDALLEIWPVFEAFQTQYVAKGLILDAEKNVSAPSPTGPSAEATDTARPARAPARTAPQD